MDRVPRVDVNETCAVCKLNLPIDQFVFHERLSDLAHVDTSSQNLRLWAIMNVFKYDATDGLVCRFSDICNEKFVNYSGNLWQHAQQHGIDLKKKFKFEANEFPEIVISKYGFPEDLKPYCMCCHKFFPDLFALQTHLGLIEHDNFPFFCNICRRVENNSVLMHLNDNHSSLLYSCPICQFLCRPDSVEKDNFFKHILDHIQEANFDTNALRLTDLQTEIRTPIHIFLDRKTVRMFQNCLVNNEMVAPTDIKISENYSFKMDRTYSLKLDSFLNQDGKPVFSFILQMYHNSLLEFLKTKYKDISLLNLYKPKLIRDIPKTTIASWLYSVTTDNFALSCEIAPICDLSMFPILNIYSKYNYMYLYNREKSDAIRFASIQLIEQDPTRTEIDITDYFYGLPTLHEVYTDEKVWKTVYATSETYTTYFGHSEKPATPPFLRRIQPSDYYFTTVHKHLQDLKNNDINFDTILLDFNLLGHFPNYSQEDLKIELRVMAPMLTYSFVAQAKEVAEIADVLIIPYVYAQVCDDELESIIHKANSHLNLMCTALNLAVVDIRRISTMFCCKKPLNIECTVPSKNLNNKNILTNMAFNKLRNTIGDILELSQKLRN